MTSAPRSYWRSLSDEQLIEARDEYRRVVDQGGTPRRYSADELEQTVADIDDDLARRAAERDQRTVDAMGHNWHAIAGWGAS